MKVESSGRMWRQRLPRQRVYSQERECKYHLNCKFLNSMAVSRIFQFAQIVVVTLSFFCLQIENKAAYRSHFSNDFYKIIFRVYWVFILEVNSFRGAQAILTHAVIAPPMRLLPRGVYQG